MDSNFYPFDSARPIDVICMGRVAVDFYAEQIGTPLKDAQSFRRYLGGCAGNISVGTSKLGLKSAMFSCVGTDDMGGFLGKTLKKEGVDTTLLRSTSDHLTALVILGVDPPDRFPLIFYRENCADMQIRPEDVDDDFFQQSKSLLITGTGLSTPSMKRSTLQAVKTAKSTGTAVIMDIDYRPVLWGLTAVGDGESRYTESDIVTKELQQVLPFLDLIVGTEEEIRIMAAGSSLQEDLALIREHTKAPIVVKTGSKGCDIYLWDLTSPVQGKPFPVEILNVLGAGDAFMSGFLRGWLRKEPFATCAEFGNANGALVVSRHGCAPAMASFEELDYFIKNYSGQETLAATQMAQLHRKTELGSARDRELFILAFDHRLQFEQSLLNNSRGADSITLFKNRVFAGFLKAREEMKMERGAVLVDPGYGREIIRQCLAMDLPLGIPVEKAGSLPVEWISEAPVYHTLLERSPEAFVKVLWYYHPTLDSFLKKQQIDRLKELYLSCYNLDRRLMLELVIPNNYRTDGDALAESMDEVYQHGIFPYWWKIKAVDSKAEWKRITNVLDGYDSNAAIVMLGGGSSLDSFKDWFEIVKTSDHCVGFAIGRTVFWKVWEDFLAGVLPEEDIPLKIAENYRQLVNTWDNI